MGKPVRDLTGQRFGKLVVIERGPSAHNHARWICRCDCGGQSLTYRGELVSGKAKSCGCEQGKKPQSAYGKRHGTRLYDAWRNMKARCGNENRSDHKNYGGRGIYVCERWLNDFEAFAADMGEPPEGSSLERNDNDGPYSPENCKWATRIEQNKNQRHQWRKGAGNPNSKLTAKDIDDIRGSALGAVALARAFRVSRHTIWLVRKQTKMKEH